MKKITGLCLFALSASVLSAGCAGSIAAAPAVSQIESRDAIPESVLLQAIFIRERLAGVATTVAPRGVIRLSGPSLPDDLARLLPDGSGCAAPGNVLEVVNKTKFVLTVSVDGAATKFLDSAGVVGYLAAGQKACVQLNRAAVKRLVTVTAHLVNDDEAIELISIKHEQATVREDKTFSLVVDYARLLAR